MQRRQCIVLQVPQWKLPLEALGLLITWLMPSNTCYSPPIRWWIRIRPRCTLPRHFLTEFGIWSTYLDLDKKRPWWHLGGLATYSSRLKNWDRQRGWKPEIILQLENIPPGCGLSGSVFGFTTKLYMDPEDQCCGSVTFLYRSGSDSAHLTSDSDSGSCFRLWPSNGRSFLLTTFWNYIYIIFQR